MTISLSRRSSKTFAKSVSTDGSEGRLARNVQEQQAGQAAQFPRISEEASETVSNFLLSLVGPGDGSEDWEDGYPAHQNHTAEVVKRIGEVADGVFEVDNLT